MGLFDKTGCMTFLRHFPCHMRDYALGDNANHFEETIFIYKYKTVQPEKLHPLPHSINDKYLLAIASLHLAY